MEVVVESINLKIEIEKIKQQFIQLLSTFDEPQPASLSDAQTYLKHLYEWKKRKSCNENISLTKFHTSKKSQCSRFDKDKTSMHTPRESSSNCSNALDVNNQPRDQRIHNKTFINYKETSQNKTDPHLKSSKISSSNKENSHLTNLLPDSTLSWDSFMDMSVLPRDSIVHDCDSFMHEENVFESTVNFPINSTILSYNEGVHVDDTLLQKNKIDSSEFRCYKYENLLNRAYHPYKRTISNISKDNVYQTSHCKDPQSKRSKISQSTLKAENINHFNKGLMSVLNTCQFESFYNTIDTDENLANKKNSLRKQKAVSCLQSCTNSSKSKDTYQFPISSFVSCNDIGKKSKKIEMQQSNKSSKPVQEVKKLKKNVLEYDDTSNSMKKSPKDFLCLPLFTS